MGRTHDGPEGVTWPRIRPHPDPMPGGFRGSRGIVGDGLRWTRPEVHRYHRPGKLHRCNVPPMARPRIIDPSTGRSRFLTVRISEEQHEQLVREASERSVSVGALVRARLSPQPDPATEAVSA